MEKLAAPIIAIVSVFSTSRMMPPSIMKMPTPRNASSSLSASLRKRRSSADFPCAPARRRLHFRSPASRSPESAGERSVQFRCPPFADVYGRLRGLSTILDRKARHHTAPRVLSGHRYDGRNHVSVTRLLRCDGGQGQLTSEIPAQLYAIGSRFVDEAREVVKVYCAFKRSLVEYVPYKD